jgi:DNA transposition AAA+ family ATPase
MNLEIKGRLEDALDKYGVSQAKAARDMGYSASVISSYRAGNYAGDIEKLEDSIIKWIARQAQARARKKVPVVETGDLRHITNAIRTAHAEKDVALIVADAGSGKTTAVYEYVKNNEKTALLINVVSGMNRRLLVQEIAKQLSVDTARVQLNTLIQNVAEALMERDAVVILDEADYLKADALEFVRRLVYDLGQSGLVLIGLPRLKGMIQNLKNDHRQLESRIGVYLSLSGLSKNDASLIAKTVWPSVDSKVVNAIYEISRTDIRQFVKIIERMQTTMALNKAEEPNLEFVELAASLIIRRNWR